MNSENISQSQTLLSQLRKFIWSVGMLLGIFGLADRGAAAWIDNYLSAIDLTQLFTIFFLLLAWLCLNPELNFAAMNASWQFNAETTDPALALLPAPRRMLELRSQHILSQRYILPIPYICQIYHLLNLKHLETVHAFSLNNLKVANITNFELTPFGGTVQFQTVLNPAFNILKMWRQPMAEAKLTLYAPYTVELCIPAYSSKNVIVIFNAIPIDAEKHNFLIDIYSDLNWPKPLLQIIFHLAAYLTLLEDLPYLHKISQTGVANLVKLKSISGRNTRQLFRRFVELYDFRIDATQADALQAFINKLMAMPNCLSCSA